ncbi:hypothetical protein AN958_06212 [Leucoagaricus sp. SymC.cos]|nr:hypothetical protein AN958_06212 [Leucoagaricus sp. SymC.cos]
MAKTKIDKPLRPAHQLSPQQLESPDESEHDKMLSKAAQGEDNEGTARGGAILEGESEENREVYQAFDPDEKDREGTGVDGKDDNDNNNYCMVIFYDPKTGEL